MKIKQNLSSVIFLLLIANAVSCCTKEKKEDKNTAHHHLSSSVDHEEYIQKVNEGTIKSDTLKGSPERTAMGFIEECHVHITYGSPSIKNRVIWGGLVPYGQLWVTGAHHATKISFSTDVLLNGQKLPAGQYAFFTIPGKKNWTVIFNSKAQQHLTDEYNKSNNALQFEVTPQISEQEVPRLTYSIEEFSNNTGVLTMAWEKLKITFDIQALHSRTILQPQK
jgi:hypothetical protein